MYSITYLIKYYSRQWFKTAGFFGIKFTVHIHVVYFIVSLHINLFELRKLC